ncbi:MAG: hypothetical protein GYA21_12500 [Myxococcales bacterium]|nr:hypothetical protein [Myxococcales bacterium]
MQTVASAGTSRRTTTGPLVVFLAAPVLSLVFYSCVSARINVVDERTALENQILGRYQELDESLLQLASVRGGQDEGWTPEQASVRDAAIRARRVQRFVQDDVDELLRLGCLGEGRTARLVPRACDEAGKDPKLEERIQRVARLENEARQAILIFVIETTPEFSRKDLPRLESAWARLRAEQAPAGTWLEDPDGAWKKK